MVKPACRVHAYKRPLGVGTVAVWERIKALERELRRLGYYEFQIREIIREAAGDTPLERLSPEAAERVVERLAEQVAFAKRCLRPGAD